MRTSGENGSVRMGMRCERCAASLGPDLATALLRKTDQLQQFGLAEADGFILEPMISPDGRDRSGANGCERRKRDARRREP